MELKEAIEIIQDLINKHPVYNPAWIVIKNELKSLNEKEKEMYDDYMKNIGEIYKLLGGTL